MQKLQSYFFSDYNYKSQSVWFKRLLYLFLVLESIYYLLYYDLLFGENSIVFVSPKSIGIFKDLAYLLYDSGSSQLSRYFILSVIALSLLNLATSRFRRVADILLWLLVINLHNRIYPTLTAGDNLLTQFLFFNCFLSSTFVVSENWKASLKICIHNVSVLALMIQICLLYFLSAFAKLADPSWISGHAIMEVSQIRHFSLYSFLRYSKNLEPVLILSNYVVLFYQVCFPVVVWIKKTKKIFLLVGILMHLYIAFVMGLVGFGFVMILAYVFFWPSKQPVKELSPRSSTGLFN